MSGTKEGSISQAKTIAERYGKEKDGRLSHYVRIGRLGGKAKVPKGFAVNKELASTAGRKGGQNGKRGKAVKQ